MDCVVDIGGGNYREVQIKYRENKPIFTARFAKPRDNFFIVCWLNDNACSDFWTIPSKVSHKLGRHRISGHSNYVQLITDKQGSDNYTKVAEYHYNFAALLSGATSDVHKAVQKASRRVEGQHLRQPDFEKEILCILSDSKEPLRGLDIITKLKERMQSRFLQADLECLKVGQNSLGIYTDVCYLPRVEEKRSNRDEIKEPKGRY